MSDPFHEKDDDGWIFCDHCEFLICTMCIAMGVSGVWLYRSCFIY